MSTLTQANKDVHGQLLCHREQIPGSGDRQLHVSFQVSAQIYFDLPATFLQSGQTIIPAVTGGLGDYHLRKYGYPDSSSTAAPDLHRGHSLLILLFQAAAIR